MQFERLKILVSKSYSFWRLHYIFILLKIEITSTYFKIVLLIIFELL